jgi:hypothetical protein
MRFKKIVFVRYLPLTKAIYTDLYFEELINNHFSVEYLDVSALFNLKKAPTITFDFSNTILIKSYNELDSYLSKNGNDNVLFISIMTYDAIVIKLFRHFTKYKVKLGVFARGVFPEYTLDEKHKIKKYLKVFKFKSLYSFCGNKLAYLFKKYKFIKTYDIIFKAGDYGYKGLGIGSDLECKNAEIVNVNTVDYDQYLSSRAQSENAHNDKIIFLDQYLPYHPDAINFKIKPVEPTRYYQELNSFFDKLEKGVGKKIIIAAHPKAEKYKSMNPFKDREIVFNQSNDLVKNSSLVLTHASTAVCFPICYQKQIILISSKQINETLPHFNLTSKAIELACGAKLMDMDGNNEIIIPPFINEEKYIKYKYNYLTSTQSENFLSKNIFINYLKTEFERN